MSPTNWHWPPRRGGAATNAACFFCYTIPFFFGSCVVLASLVAAADEGAANPESCENLPEAQRPLCLMVQACATLADVAQRQECYNAAAERYAEAQPRDRDQAVVPEDAPPAIAETREVPGEREVVTSGPSPRATRASTEASGGGERIGTLTRVRRLFAGPSAARGPEIPRRFTAEVTAHRKLVRDRQLLVLDDKLLFEGDNASSSAIGLGDVVKVVKASSFRGRKYQITGPTRRSFEALRIRCERTDLGTDNRRKCNGMMGGEGQ
ncbi:MAG: hypothetical protein OXH15_16595 [Gammaproteobacteria bacterium]|nr:hypothetical protein [Gammaproteobacteria bacterium]